MRNSTAQRWYSGILFPILLLVLISPTFELECTWKTQEADKAADGYQYKEFLMIGSLSNCQQECEDERINCTLITYDHPVYCRLFETRPEHIEDSSGVTMIEIESCPGDTTTTTTTTTTESPSTGTPPCAMVKTPDVRPTASAVQSVQMATVCNDLCKMISTCRAYSKSSSECHLFTSVPSTTTNSSFTHVVVQNNCEVSSESGKKGTGAWQILALDATSCNTVCLEWTQCTAVACTTNQCDFYNTGVSDTTSNAAYDLYKKQSSCPAGTVSTRTCSGQSSVTRAQTSKHLALWVSLTVALALLHELQ